MDADEGSCWWSAVGSYSAYGSSSGIPGPSCRGEDPLCTEGTGDLERGAGQPCGWIAESNYFSVGIVEHVEYLLSIHCMFDSDVFAHYKGFSLVLI